MTNLILVIIETLWIPIDATFFFAQFTAILNIVVVKNSLCKKSKTTWIIGGGPEDPDEEEDIDKKGAYLHFEIKVAPWIYWTTNFEI